MHSTSPHRSKVPRPVQATQSQRSRNQQLRRRCGQGQHAQVEPEEEIAEDYEDEHEEDAEDDAERETEDDTDGEAEQEQEEEDFHDEDEETAARRHVAAFNRGSMTAGRVEVNSMETLHIIKHHMAMLQAKRIRIEERKREARANREARAAQHHENKRTTAAAVAHVLAHAGVTCKASPPSASELRAFISSQQETYQLTGQQLKHIRKNAMMNLIAARTQAQSQ